MATYGYTSLISLVDKKHPSMVYLSSMAYKNLTCALFNIAECMMRLLLVRSYDEHLKAWYIRSDIPS